MIQKYTLLIQITLKLIVEEREGYLVKTRVASALFKHNPPTFVAPKLALHEQE